MSPTNVKPPPNPMTAMLTIKSEPADTSDQELPAAGHPVDYEEKPTDLSMEGPTDLSNNSRHISIVCSPDPPIQGPQN
ncbi:unnamed protein product [Phaedon cochleariae]|uniref:Uncharacterized protein n=1 Tax=Phaedon cochleariae TaxID=80249 RepID=A0A9N9X4F5_PHACE|nr:unnamed protein product [Phaedon cochleariae]